MSITPKIIFFLSITSLISCKKDSSTNSVPSNSTNKIIKDASGNTYSSVKIGTQEWLSSDLKTTKFRNGDPIPSVKIDSILKDITAPKFHFEISDTSTLVDRSGIVYTWFVSTDSRGVCPEGFHVPNAVEWQVMFDHLGGNFAPLKLVEPRQLSSCSNIDKTIVNSSGFTAIYRKYRIEGDACWCARCSYVKYSAYEYDFIGSANWWTTSIDKNRLNLVTSCDPQPIDINYINENSGLPIRCIKD